MKSFGLNNTELQLQYNVLNKALFQVQRQAAIYWLFLEFSLMGFLSSHIDGQFNLTIDWDSKIYNKCHITKFKHNKTLRCYKMGSI